MSIVILRALLTRSHWIMGMTITNLLWWYT